MIDKSNWEFDYPLPITEPKLPTKDSEQERLEQDCVQGIEDCKCKCLDDWIDHGHYERDNGSYNDYYYCYRCNTTTQTG